LWMEQTFQLLISELGMEGGPAAAKPLPVR